MSLEITTDYESIYNLTNWNFRNNFSVRRQVQVAQYNNDRRSLAVNSFTLFPSQP